VARPRRPGADLVARSVKAGHDQAGHRVRLEWGPAGGAAVAAGVDVAVVVDVLSFTTTVSIAVERGIRVWPFGWHDERAATYAAELDAVLAVGRLEARERPRQHAPDQPPRDRPVTLSPAAMRSVSGVERLVLPSPNGSTVSAALAERGAVVVAACLRNRAAVASWLAPRVEAGAAVAVVPAGERWPDGSLRPCAEDLWGSGAVLAGLLDLDGAVAGVLSPEADVAVAAWRAVEHDVEARLHACASGVELVAAGFGADVAVAAETDVSDVVPVLSDAAFGAARRH